MERFQVTAEESDSGLRLDKFLALKLPELTRNRIQGLIEAGEVKQSPSSPESHSDSRAIHSKAGTSGEMDAPRVSLRETQGMTMPLSRSHKVKAGEIYALTLPPPVPTHMVAKDIPLNVVYEDEHLLVIDKQAGLTVHPGAGNHDDTMANALVAHCGDSLSGIGGVQRPGIVHRLDKDTSGLLVVAKNDAAHTNLSEQLATRDLQRKYLAVVWGVPIPPAGKITANIGRNPKDRKKMAALKSTGKPAVTHYRIVEKFPEGVACLVECRLETGRTHQIRVHFQHKGHPLLGDSAYGKKPGQKIWERLPEAVRDFRRQALHSTFIGFTHPESGEWMEFSSPLGGETCKDMQKLVESLRLSS